MLDKKTDFFSKTKVYKYFSKNLLENKKARDSLIALEELLNIKKNIKEIYNTDEPEKIKNLIGKKLKNFEITEKDYNYVNLINDKYNIIYEECKKILENQNEIK